MSYMPPGVQPQQMQHQPQQCQTLGQPAQTMQALRQPAPTFQSAAASTTSIQSAAASASANPYDFDAMWNRLLPGKYGILIPMFRNDRRPRDIREVEDQTPKVIAFLEAWENVPKNKQPK
eukprot:2056033-Amphidinium_carterae.1